MILESYGLIKSIFPFIKEIFLWRDGIELGKPVTKHDLRRRQIATYVMAGSLFFNWILGYKIIQLGGVVVQIRKREVAREDKRLDLSTMCPAPVKEGTATKDIGKVAKHTVKHHTH